MTSWLWSFLCAAGGITFHIWRKQMLHFFLFFLLLAELSLSLSVRFRAVIVSVSTSEQPHASTSPFLFFFFFLFCLGSVTFRGGEFVPSEVFRREKKLFLFSAMGDIEAPSSTRPRQTVLLSVLPSKEFATSRKGMLLIAEVVRTDQREEGSSKRTGTHRDRRSDARYCAPTRVKSVRARRVFGHFDPLLSLTLIHIQKQPADWLTVIVNIGQAHSVTRFPLVKGGAETERAESWNKHL